MYIVYNDSYENVTQHEEGIGKLSELPSIKDSAQSEKTIAAQMNVEDDIQSIAESCRSTSSVMRSIHSQKSMKAIVSKCRERMIKKDIENKVEPLPEFKVFPIVITHQEDNGARIAETKSLSKLPFKNRNPAL